METKVLKRLPVGIQTYSEIVNLNCVYIDKTEYIYKMINLSKYIFLSRPRRFGKSLLVSTLQSYFEGKKELFEGLFIDSVEKDWTEYPVLRFDMSLAKHQTKEDLPRYLLYIIEDNEKKFGLTSDIADPNLRLTNLITTVYKQTGKQVVVLIDEYDAPLLDVAHEKARLDDLRQIMRNFYSPLKACDPYLRFVFITGITKFSQLSIFSELNNLKNISMDPAFAAVCGISEEEIQTQMSDYLDDFAVHQEITREEAMTALKKQYDGYHFSWPSPDMYNPFSLLNAFQDRMLKSYWFESGTPTFLIEMMRKFNVKPSDIEEKWVVESAFNVTLENMNSILPVLYQTGCLTIKNCDKRIDLYRLDIPNQEVSSVLKEVILPRFVSTE